MGAGDLERVDGRRGPGLPGRAWGIVMLADSDPGDPFLGGRITPSMNVTVHAQQAHPTFMATAAMPTLGIGGLTLDASAW